MRELQAGLSEMIRPGQRTAIMGVGSVLMSDDAAGTYLIELLASELCSENLLLIEGSTAPENFTGVIKEFAPDILFIIDAARMGLPAGAIRMIDKTEIGGMSFSTHMLPLSVMLRYLELETGCQVICIGIQPACTEQGFEMCPDVDAGAKRLAKIFVEALTVC